MNIVDEEKRIKHNKLATNIETVIQDGKKYLQPGMDKEQVRGLCRSEVGKRDISPPGHVRVSRSGL